jgi:hypothetical protein
MHQCKETRERITELLLNGRDVDLDSYLRSEVGQCAECRVESDSLKQTLRLTTRLMETVSPSEVYWSGYHARLKQKLMDTQVPPRVETSRERSWLLKVLTASVRVPLPVAALLLLALGLTVVLASRRSQTKRSEAPAPSIVRVPVEVPVIQERTVTRVVYRDRAVPRRVKPTIDASASDAAVAGSRKPVNDANQITLTGFRPLEEIKLTVIKGGSSNEK